MQRLPKIDVIHFDKIPNEIHTYNNPLLNILGNRLKEYHMSAYSFQLVGKWASFYSSNFNAKSRQTDRRKYKKLTGLGEVTFKVFDQTCDLEKIIKYIV